MIKTYILVLKTLLDELGHALRFRGFLGFLGKICTQRYLKKLFVKSVHSDNINFFYKNSKFLFETFIIWHRYRQYQLGLFSDRFQKIALIFPRKMKLNPNIAMYSVKLGSDIAMYSIFEFYTVHSDDISVYIYIYIFIYAYNYN